MCTFVFNAMATCNCQDEHEVVLQEECEVLRSIYLEDVNIEEDDRGIAKSVNLLLHPATGDDLDKKYVCMTLIINIPQEYPDTIPEIIIKNPRGIAEEEIQSLHDDLLTLANDRKGGHMLYDIIEMAKETLTDGNIPHYPCAICLEHFHKYDKFDKTSCYHYFHRHCLACHVMSYLEMQREEATYKVKHMSEEEPNEEMVICPVCREQIAVPDDIEEYSSSQMNEESDASADVNIVLSDDVRAWQKEMAAKLAEQRARGGIIDVEAEKNKYLLTESDSVLLPSPRNVTDKETTSDSKPESNTSRRNERRRNIEHEREERQKQENHFKGHKSAGRGKGHNSYQDRPSSGYRNRPYSSYNKDRDRPSSGYNKDRDRSSSGYNKDRDRPSSGYNKDRDRPSSGYNKDRDRSSRGYNKDRDRPSSSYKKGKDRTSSNYNKEKTSNRKGENQASDQKPENSDSSTGHADVIEKKPDVDEVVAEQPENQKGDDSIPKQTNDVSVCNGESQVAKSVDNHLANGEEPKSRTQQETVIENVESLSKDPRSGGSRSIGTRSGDSKSIGTWSGNSGSAESRSGNSRSGGSRSDEPHTQRDKQNTNSRVHNGQQHRHDHGPRHFGRNYGYGRGHRESGSSGHEGGSWSSNHRGNRRREPRQDKGRESMEDKGREPMQDKRREPMQDRGNKEDAQDGQDGGSDHNEAGHRGNVMATDALREEANDKNIQSCDRDSEVSRVSKETGSTTDQDGDCHPESSRGSYREQKRTERQTFSDGRANRQGHHKNSHDGERGSQKGHHQHFHQGKKDSYKGHAQSTPHGERGAHKDQYRNLHNEKRGSHKSHYPNLHSEERGSYKGQNPNYHHEKKGPHKGNAKNTPNEERELNNKKVEGGKLDDGDGNKNSKVIAEKETDNCVQNNHMNNAHQHSDDNFSGNQEHAKGKGGRKPYSDTHTYKNSKNYYHHPHPHHESNKQVAEGQGHSGGAKVPEKMQNRKEYPGEIKPTLDGHVDGQSSGAKHHSQESTGKTLKAPPGFHALSNLGPSCPPPPGFQELS